MRQLSEAAQAAKLIRKELKANFPKVKFSVITSNYSMGNSITVSYSDNLANEAVRKVVDKYQDGDFDGMTDSYDHRKSNGLPRAKFVFVQRG